MIKDAVLKKTIFFSLLGHLTVFGIFSFSFGNRIPKANYASVSFWGQFFSNSQLIPRQTAFAAAVGKPRTTGLDPWLSVVRGKITSEPILGSGKYLRNLRNAGEFNNNLVISCGLKPPLYFPFTAEKEIFAGESQPRLFSFRKKDQAIIFHPLLPYSFPLYFKDRQIAHVELAFKIISFGPRNSILIKRRISSGNLEVDLLTMRYISHYLFIQQASFAPDNWQSVKIDLSAKND